MQLIGNALLEIDHMGSLATEIQSALSCVAVHSFPGL